MEYYIFTWDTAASTFAVQHDEQLTLDFLNKLANFCLELTSELPKVEVTSIGDGQRIIFPIDTDLETIVRPTCASVNHYAQSLTSEYPDYKIRAILSRGLLYDGPLGKNGSILWTLDTTMHSIAPGEYQDLAN